MRVLLDTHAWLWWVSSSSKLGEEARSIIRDPANTLYFSAASAWEIAIKYRLGKLTLPESPEEFVLPRLERDALSPLSVETRHAFRVAALEAHHRDPFDRLLIAQAQIEQLPIMTSDPEFSPYGIEIIPAGR